MTQFEYHNAANDEASQRKSVSWMLSQTTTPGKATTGVLSGLGVTQTSTASSSVNIAAGAGVVQAATLDGASLLVNDTLLVLDVLGPNPMGGLPRNDIVVFDLATLTAVGSGASGGLRVIVGTPNASPTDPAVPTSAIPLARLRHAASATTVPTASIDSLASATLVAGARLAAVTATGSTTSTSGASEITVATAPTVVGDGARRFKVSLTWFSVHTTVDNTTAELRLYRGATLLQSTRLTPTHGSSGVLGGSSFASDVPPAGSAVYAAKIVRIAGSGVVTVNSTIQILVEHVG